MWEHGDEWRQEVEARMKEFDELFESYGLPENERYERRILLIQKVCQLLNREHETFENRCEQMDRETIEFHAEVQRLRGLLELEPFVIDESMKIYPKRELLHTELVELQQNYDERHEEQMDLIERYNALIQIRSTFHELSLKDLKEKALLTQLESTHLNERVTKLAAEIEDCREQLVQLQDIAKQFTESLAGCDGPSKEHLHFIELDPNGSDIQLNDSDMDSFRNLVTELQTLHNEKFREQMADFERICEEIEKLSEACAIPVSERKEYSKPINIVGYGLYGNGTIEFINLDNYAEIKEDFEQLKTLYEERSETLDLYAKWKELWEEANRLDWEATKDKKHYAKGKAQLDAFTKA
ncbi:hypothetical protein L596_016144 [Steinernema carpocapsae]|uniref:Uncharacterized protein n=1 Tax=Steinernema carpocapsae TaxID=34508 RepID=A0A4V6A3B7_STECR|nr:hypothetical protein L596_016144 [Steinernema carpocapsae]